MKHVIFGFLFSSNISTLSEKSRHFAPTQLGPDISEECVTTRITVCSPWHLFKAGPSLILTHLGPNPTRRKSLLGYSNEKASSLPTCQAGTAVVSENLRGDEVNK